MRIEERPDWGGADSNRPARQQSFSNQIHNPELPIRYWFCLFRVRLYVVTVHMLSLLPIAGSVLFAIRNWKCPFHVHPVTLFRLPSPLSLFQLLSAFLRNCGAAVVRGLRVFSIRNPKSAIRNSSPAVWTHGVRRALQPIPDLAETAAFPTPARDGGVCTFFFRLLHAGTSVCSFLPDRGRAGRAAAHLVASASDVRARTQDRRALASSVSAAGAGEVNPPQGSSVRSSNTVTGPFRDGGERPIRTMTGNRIITQMMSNCPICMMTGSPGTVIPATGRRCLEAFATAHALEAQLRMLTHAWRHHRTVEMRKPATSTGNCGLRISDCGLELPEAASRSLIEPRCCCLTVQPQAANPKSAIPEGRRLRIASRGSEQLEISRSLIERASSPLAVQSAIRNPQSAIPLTGVAGRPVSSNGRVVAHDRTSTAPRAFQPYSRRPAAMKLVNHSPEPHAKSLVQTARVDQRARWHTVRPAATLRIAPPRRGGVILEKLATEDTGKEKRGHRELTIDKVQMTN